MHKSSKPHQEDDKNNSDVQVTSCFSKNAAANEQLVLKQSNSTRLVFIF